MRDGENEMKYNERRWERQEKKRVQCASPCRKYNITDSEYNKNEIYILCG